MIETATPTRRFIQSLGDGDNVDEVYLVVEKQLRANRNGNLFLQLELRDRTGSISARLWNAGEPLFRSFEAGDFLLIKGKVQLFQGSLQIILNNLDRVPSQKISLADFLPHTDKDVSKLLERLKALLRKQSNPHLRALAECFLMDEELMQAVSRAPAGIRNHHAFIGGLLEHVVNMLEVADRIAPLYPEVDRDLLTMGVFLHDIGKVRELSYDRAFAYTDEGSIGQIAVNVRDAKRAIAFYRDVLGMEFLFEVPRMGFFNCEGIRLMLAELHHPASVIYYGVADIRQMFDALSQAGVEFTSPPRKIATVGAHDLWMAFFRDLDDNVLGLMSEVPRA